MICSALRGQSRTKEVKEGETEGKKTKERRMIKGRGRAGDEKGGL